MSLLGYYGSGDRSVTVSDIKVLNTDEDREAFAKSLNWHLKHVFYKANSYDESGEDVLRNAIFMIRFLVFFQILDSDAGDQLLVELHACEDRRRSIYI